MLKMSFKPVQKASLAAFICVATGTAACAASSEPARSPDVWRHAKVLQIGQADTHMRLVDHDCRKWDGKEHRFTRYALVLYNPGSSSKISRRVVVGIPDDTPASVGAHVLINPRDCSAGLKMAPEL